MVCEFNGDLNKIETDELVKYCETNGIDAAIDVIKKLHISYKNLIAQVNRFKKETFSTKSERVAITANTKGVSDEGNVSPKTEKHSVMPPSNDNAPLDNEGNNKNNKNNKSGRINETHNELTDIIQKVINGEMIDGKVDGFNVVVNEIDDKDETCPECGEKLTTVGYDYSAKVDVKPAELIIVVNKKAKKICKKCGIMISDSAGGLVNRSTATINFKALLIVAKYLEGTPIYRLDSTKNYPLNYDTLLNYILKSGEKLHKLAVEIEKSIFLKNEKKIFGVDETHFKVINPEIVNGKKLKKNYIFVLVNELASVYKFTGHRYADWLYRLVADLEFVGWLISDKYGAYNIFDINYVIEKNKKIELQNQEIRKKNQKIIEKNKNRKDGKVQELLKEIPLLPMPIIKGRQLCLCHLRRTIYYAYLALPTILYDDPNTTPYKLLMAIRKIFLKERELKNLSSEERFRVRNSDEYQKMIDDFKNIIDSTNPGDNSYLNDAIKYAKNQWDSFWTYRKNGDLVITNQKTENAVKPVAMIRNGSLNFNNPRTAVINCDLLTIVQTAKKNGIDVYQYVRYVLRYIDEEPIQNLLPWSENLFKRSLDF